MRTSFGKLLPIVALTALFASCSDDGDPGATGGSSETGADSSGPDSATATQGMSSTTATTTASTSVGTDQPTTASSEESMGFINPDSGGESGPMPPGPNGAQCGGEEECESGFCYQIPMLGGVCSECLMDADCGTGTCSVDFNAMYAVCTDGALGNMCDSDEGCMGELVCTELIDTGGLFNASFCSECGPTAPCMGDAICTPVFDTMGLGGHSSCADPGSVDNGSGCPLVDGMGDGAVCSSGHCGVADVIMGFLLVGVCGECDVDDDCADGQTCTPASGGMGGLMGATCT
jgi:hypothetical protein